MTPTGLPATKKARTNSTCLLFGPQLVRVGDAARQDEPVVLAGVGVADRAVDLEAYRPCRGGRRPGSRPLRVPAGRPRRRPTRPPSAARSARPARLPRWTSGRRSVFPAIGLTSAAPLDSEVGARRVDHLSVGETVGLLTRAGTGARTGQSRWESSRRTVLIQDRGYPRPWGRNGASGDQLEDVALDPPPAARRQLAVAREADLDRDARRGSGRRRAGRCRSGGRPRACCRAPPRRWRRPR